MPGGPALTERPAPGRTRRRPVGVGEAAGLVVAVLLIALAFATEPLGWYGGNVHQWLPPVSAHLEPELHGWLAVAVAAAVVTVGYGPTLAATLPWRRLLALTWLVGAVWGVGLALGRGWQEGFVDPLDSDDEYLVDVDRAANMGVARVLAEYTDYILLADDPNWTTHNSGHPPVPLLFYLLLDRVGLGGSVASGLVTAAIGSLLVVAVLAALRVLGDEERARAVAPFLALTPLAIWVWISADGIFATVAAAGLAVLAAAAVAPPGRRAALLAATAGIVLGIGIFLSYGLVLMGPLALGVLVAARQWRPLPAAVGGALLVVAAFAAAGFWWYEGQQVLAERYYEGKGELRQFSYWVWGNLAVVALALGPAVWAACGAAVARFVRAPRAALGSRSGVGWLATGAAVAIVAADVSALSKSEVERIWLPFLVWLVPLTAWLPAGQRRWWLAAQATWALGLCVLFRTTW